MRTRDYIQYPVTGPHMNRSVPENQIKPGSFGRVVGVDGRYTGGLRKFYGMKEVVDFNDVTGMTNIDVYEGVSFCKAVTFQKRGTATTYRGYVVRWDVADDVTEQEVCLVYTEDNGSNWTRLVILATGNGITGTVGVDVASAGPALLVCVDGETPMTVHYTGSSLVAVAMGPGTYADASNLPALELERDGASPYTTAADTYYLKRGGTYQIAYRLYDPVRGIYTALKPAVVASIPDLADYYKCTVTINYGQASAHAAYTAGFTYIDVFRTIDLGTGTAASGAIFYLEQTITNWDGKDVDIDVGTVFDDALPFLTMYNPETDIVKVPPSSGTIGRYQGLTFIGEAPDVDGGYDTYHSSLEHVSPEYFSTYNKWEGNAEVGRPLRYLKAGDAMFILCNNGITHVYKPSKLQPLRFTFAHLERGLAGKGAAHTAGNSIFMISSIGLIILDGTNSNMSQVTAADRIIFDDWAGHLADVESGYDAMLNASMFLNSTDAEVLMVFHSTQSVSMLEGANFVSVSTGPDITTGSVNRAHFVTKKGLVVVPDYDRSGTGTMWGLPTGKTVNGTVTQAHATYIIDSSATFHDEHDIKGAYVYMTSGNNAGEKALIVTSPITTTVRTGGFTNSIAVGDRYAVSPVPFKVRMWPLIDIDPAVAVFKFLRWNVTGLSLKVRGLSGFTSNDNNKWLVGVHRNSSSTVEGAVELDVDANPADSAVALNIDGIDVEPYIEQIAAGVDFELTNAEVSVTMSTSRNVTA